MNPSELDKANGKYEDEELLIKQELAKAWRLAPDCARWIAQDADGEFWWYAYKPILLASCFYEEQFGVSSEKTLSVSLKSTAGTGETRYRAGRNGKL